MGAETVRYERHLSALGPDDYVHERWLVDEQHLLQVYAAAA
jgi:hypothetical protein